MNIFGYEDFVDIFLIKLYLGVISMHLRVFSLVKVQKGDIFWGLLKFQIFWGA